MELGNSYFLMRHGTSRANTAGIIVSSPDFGINDWGLSPDADRAIRISVRNSRLGSETLIFSSDFLRTRQTAIIVSEALGSKNHPGYFPVPALRERFFGHYDMGNDEKYRELWAMDEAGHDAGGIESTESVLNRLLGFISTLEHQHENRDILLVSHGDPLNILLAAFAGLPSHRHRDIPGMNTAEIRRLQEDLSSPGFL